MRGPDRRHVIALVVGGVACRLTPVRAEQVGTLRISSAWVRLNPGGRRMTAAYMQITNTGTDSAALVDASCPLAGKTELHRTVVTDGVARMQRMDSLAIAAGETGVLEPGGAHVMLMALQRDLRAGESIPLRLVFADARVVEIQAEVRARPPG